VREELVTAKSEPMRAAEKNRANERMERKLPTADKAMRMRILVFS